jgi:hypothetical protein
MEVAEYECRAKKECAEKAWVRSSMYGGAEA